MSVSAKFQCNRYQPSVSDMWQWNYIGGSDSVQPRSSVQVAVIAKGQHKSRSSVQVAVHRWQYTGGIVHVAVAESAKGQCTRGSVQVAVAAKGQCTGGNVLVAVSAIGQCAGGSVQMALSVYRYQPMGQCTGGSVHVAVPAKW
jgi:hypothetical protein